MKYSTRTLQPGETIQYECRIWNWGRLLLAIAVAIATLILFVNSTAEQAGDALDQAVQGHASDVLRAVSVITALIALWLFSNSGTSEFTVTDRRVIFKSGLIARRVTEIPLSHVDTLGVRQSTAQRIFGGGTVALTSTGGTSIYIPSHDLLTLRRAIGASKIDR